MKRIWYLVLTLMLVFSLTGCGSPQPEAIMDGGNHPAEASAAPEDPQDFSDFPIIGTWKSEGEVEVYWRILETGDLTWEIVQRTISTTTVNGVTSSSSSTFISRRSDKWESKGNTLLLNGSAPFEMVTDGSDYKLVGSQSSYVRIGGLDYEIDTNSNIASDQSEPPAIPEGASPYVLGTPLVAPGVELTLTECGFSEDIRITKHSPGISFTSGPSPQEGKQYFYLKGTLKNTGKRAVFPAIGGKVVIDGYEYQVRTDTIAKDATPASTIEPLDEVYVLIFASIPNELANSFTEGKMAFGFNDNFSNVDITNCDHLYYVDAVR